LVLYVVRAMLMDLVGKSQYHGVGSVLDTVTEPRSATVIG
jgi:hypothetical protein